MSQSNLEARRPQILPKRTCVCGHHDREHGHDSNCYACGQLVESDGHCEIKGCDCEEYVTACQNCGDARTFSKDDFDVCSRRCLFQLEYAQELMAA